MIIIDSLDVFGTPIINDDGEEVWEIPQIFSINMVTGTTAGTHSIIPGAFLSGNFDISYGLGSLQINQSILTVTSENKQMTFGESQPPYTSIVEGFVYDDDFESVIESINYKLKDAQGKFYTTTDPIDVGIYDIIASVVLIETELRPGLPVNYIPEYVVGKLTVDCPAVPVVRSFETAVGAGSSNPVKVNKPSGTVTGDLLIVGLMFEKGNNITPTAPSGWTLVQRTNRANNIGMATYYKVAGSNEPLAYIFTLSNGPKWSIGISRITGADPSNPIDVYSGASGGPGFNADAPSVTTTMCNDLVLAFFANKKDASWTPPIGTTEVYDRPNTQQGLTSNMMAYYIQTVEGVTGTKTAVASISEFWVAQQIAIRPGVSRSGSSSGRSETTAMNTMPEETSLFEEKHKDVQAYPNPVRDQVVVRIDDLTEQPSNNDIQILDRVGRMYPVNSKWDPQNKEIEIDFTQMGTGLYMIQVRTPSGNKLIRVVKDSE